MVQKAVLFLAAGICSISLAWAGAFDSRTTAQSLFLDNYPYANLKDEGVKTQIQGLQTEIEILFDRVLTDAGQAHFSQSLPWEPGRVLLGFSPEVNQTLLPKFEKSKTLDLTRATTGITALDNILKEVGGLELTSESASGAYYSLKIPADANPRAASKVITEAKVQGLLFAEANGKLGMRAASLYRKNLTSGRVTYILFYGWGDCPAGCTSGHFKYYEMHGESVTFVGESGEAMPDAGKVLFK